ncbi:hypothetical protein K1T71_013395 [Dendrolimus kikuchii]|uniref:Uncharacterized protein n=1 Tax=Dendrolimus kikuchii TaxID=765133 RepID=A0ACC1CHZ6_9NEOP|nr:hypothetical protein K1T71_013395 [Dendrolimus kikuchii]
MTSFGIISTFDHTVQSWNTFKCRLTQWFIANDINVKTDAEGSKRRAILLSALSDGSYKLAADLAVPQDLQEVAYDTILKLLDDHFTPKRYGFTERYNFYAAVQQPGETHTQWAARLRGLAAHCNFGNVEEALRDKFVMGIMAGPEREKLFSQDIKELTLSKAIDLAENVRSARTAAAVAAPVSQQDIFKIVNNQKSTAVCAVCGRKNHSTTECRFSKYTCKKCKTKGHLQKMCKNVNYVAARDTCENDDDGKCFNIKTIHGEPMTEWIIINGLSLQFEIDSGASVSVISDVTYKKYFNKIPLSSQTKGPLYSYSGAGLDCIGVVALPVTYNGISHEINFHVISRGGPPLLGRDFMSLFKLQLSPVSFINFQNDILSQFQLLYPDLFSANLGCFNKYEVKLQTKKGSKPIFFKARPIAFALREKVSNEIDRLVNLGVLVPVEHSEYASPVVPILKRDGSVRLCADFSVTINKQLVVEQYPLPTVHELFSKLHGGQQFSKLDLSMAYNQLKLDYASQDLTCINTHRGLFKYTRLVFGLTNAPAIFQRAMERLLNGIDGVLCLLDDVLITAENRESHLNKLYLVLQRLQDAGLTLQKSKCEFFKDQINYLGYVIDKSGLKKSPEKVKAIVNAPLPNNVNQLQSFLGLVNYYRNFVANASSILTPLFDLLKKGTKWQWHDEHNKAFVSIKEMLSSEQILAHFNPNAKIILTVDASPTGLGAILSQIEGNGPERPISFASRTLNAAEKRYSQIQKEATAIIFGVRRFHQYLYGRSIPFILRTDHKPLISIFGRFKGIPEVSANRLQRYAIFLNAYNYTIEYIRGKVNSADFLSRASLIESPPNLSSDSSYNTNQFLDVSEVADRATYINFVVDGGLPVTLKILQEETKQDTVLTKVIGFVLSGWPNKVTDLDLKPYHLCKTQLSLEDGCLMRGHKVVLPKSLRLKILNELHNSHLGIVKTKAEARSRFWFPGIDKVLENMIGSCNVCMQLRSTPSSAPLAPWPFPSGPFIRLHLDFLGPINGQTYLVIVDAFTKWVEVYEMFTSATSTTVLDKLHDFIARFGLPETIVSDNGTAFTSSEFNQFCILNGISQVTSPAYCPSSNGQAESFVKIVKKGIKTSILSAKDTAEKRIRLQKYLFDYRNSIHSVTGFSPAQLVFGRKLRSRLDLLNKNTLVSPVSHESLADYVKCKQSLQCKNYKGNNHRIFERDDKVLYKRYIGNNKFKWLQGLIIKKLGKVTYLVKDINTANIVKKHTNQLIKNRNRCSSTDRLRSYELIDDINLQSEPNVTDTRGEERNMLESSQSVPDTPLPSGSTSTRQLRDIPRIDYKSLHRGYF